MRKILKSFLLLLIMPIYLMAITDLGAIDNTKVKSNESLEDGRDNNQYQFHSSINGTYNVKFTATTNNLKMKAGKSVRAQEYFRNAKDSKKIRSSSFFVQANSDVYLTIWKKKGEVSSYKLEITFIPDDPDTPVSNVDDDISSECKNYDSGNSNKNSPKVISDMNNITSSKTMCIKGETAENETYTIKQDYYKFTVQADGILDIKSSSQDDNHKYYLKVGNEDDRDYYYSEGSRVSHNSSIYLNRGDTVYLYLKESGNDKDIYRVDFDFKLKEETPNNPISATDGQGVCYAISDVKNKLYSVVMSPGQNPLPVAHSMTIIGANMDGEAGAYNSADGMIYGFKESSIGAKLYAIDPSNARARQVHLYPERVMRKNVTGASFYGGYFYVLAQNSESSSTTLYKIDPEQDWDIVKNTAINGDTTHASAIAINGSGEAYIIVDNDYGDHGWVYSIDLRTAKTTKVVHIGRSDDDHSIEAEGLSFAVDGNLYVENSETGSSYDQKLYKIDLSTGDVTSSAQIPDEVDIEGLSCNVIVPQDENEPPEIKQTPFSCEASGTVISYVTSGSASRGDSNVALISIADGSKISDTKLPSPTIGVNSIGYNVKDDYIWGYNIPTRKIVRIGSDNTINYYEMDDEPDIGGAYYNTLDVSPDGVMYMKCDSFSNRLDRVKLDGSKKTQIVLSSINLDQELNTADFAFNPKDGKIYFIDYNDGWFKRIDINENYGQIKKVKKIEAAYTVVAAFDVDGNFYYNRGEAIKKLSIQYNDSKMIKSSITVSGGLANIEGMTQGDGARCANAPMQPVDEVKLIADYHFDECSWDGIEGEVKDSSGNHHDGTSFGKAQNISEGKINRAGDFNAIDADDISGVKVDNLDIDSNKFSISLWAKTKEEIKTSTEFSQIVNFGSFALKYKHDDNKFVIHLFHPQHSTITFDAKNFKDSKFHHIYVDISDGQFRLYLDGSKIYEENVSKLIPANDTLYIGGAESGDYRYGVLSIDEVKIYDYKLSNNKIKEIISNDSNGTNEDGIKRASVECQMQSKLIAEYRFDECEFEYGKAKDNLGKYDADVESTVDIDLNGKINNAAKFSGGDVTVSNLSLDLEANKKTTVSMWIKGSDTDGMPIAWSGGGDLWIYNGKIGFNTRNDGQYGVASSISDDEWHHIVAIFNNGDIEKCKLYIDGEKKTLSKVIAPCEAYTGNFKVTDTLYIGGDVDKNKYDGDIDEVKIYKGELSAEDIKNMYDNEEAGKNTDGTDREEIICILPLGCQATALLSKETEDLFDLDTVNKTETKRENIFKNILVNAMGYNETDGYIWGYNQKSGDNDGIGRLVKIGKDIAGETYKSWEYEVDYGNFEKLTGSVMVGDISKTGQMYLLKRENGNVSLTAEKDYLYVIDLNSSSDNYLKVVDRRELRDMNRGESGTGKGLNIVDWAFHPKNGKLYGLEKYKSKKGSRLYEIDPSTDEVKTTLVTGISPEDNTSYEAFFDDNGYFYGYGSKTGKTYRLDLTNPNNLPSKAILFTDVPTDTKGGDTARCSSASMGAKPIVTIKLSDTKEGDSGVSDINITITSDRGIEKDIDIKYTTYIIDDNRNQASLSDFRKKTEQTITLKKGDNTINLPIIVGDIDVESDEVFGIKLESDDVMFLSANGIDKNISVIAKIIDDDANILDAFDMQDTQNKRIKTKIVNKEFTLEVAAFDSTGKMVDIEDMNNTKIKIVDSLKCATDLVDLNATGLVDFNVSKREYSFTVDKATKSAKVQFYWENKFGSQVSCSSDVFAIRPKEFSFTTGMSSISTIKAGEVLNISIFALDEHRDKTINYNEDESSFKVDINQTNTHCDFNSSDLNKSNMDSFTNGELNGTISYNDVGELKIDISEIVGQEFAIVDKDDTTNDNDRLISPKNIKVSFKPDRLEIVKSFKNSSSSNKSNAFYSNSDLANSPTWSLVIKALSAGGNVTKNYNSECVAHDVDVIFSFDINSTASSSQSLTMIKAVDTNSSFSFDSNITGSNITKDIDLVVTKDKFVDGEANNNLTLNFKRSKLIALPPAKVTLKDIDSIDSEDSDVNNDVNTTIFEDDNVTYKYMRAYIQDPIEVTGVNELNTTVFYEAYDPYRSGQVSKSGDRDWKIVKYDGTSGKMKFFDMKARYGSDRVVVTNNNNQTLNIKAKNVPESNKVTMDLDDDFKYITDTISTNVSFSPDSANWAGEGKVGMMVDTNVSRRTKFKRLDW